MGTCKKPADCHTRTFDCIWNSDATEADTCAIQRLIDAKNGGVAGAVEKSIGAWGGKRAGAGRPKAESSIGGKTVSAYLGSDDLEYLAKWGASNTDAIRRLIHRARLMWPKGE